MSKIIRIGHNQRIKMNAVFGVFDSFEFLEQQILEESEDEGFWEEEELWEEEDI